MYQKTFSFPQMVDRTTRRINISEKNKSVNECLGILLRTRPGELLGDPLYGCNLTNRIFQYNGVIIEQLLKEDIINAVTKYEPRIYMTTDNITIEQDFRTVRIFIDYIIKETGQLNSYNMEIASDDNPYKQTL